MLEDSATTSGQSVSGVPLVDDMVDGLFRYFNRNLQYGKQEVKWFAPCVGGIIDERLFFARAGALLELHGNLVVIDVSYR